MSGFAVLLWISNVILNATGHLAFKFVAVTEHDVELQRWKKMLASPPIWIGIACFVLEFVAWFALISVIPLSLAMLIGSINIVVVVLAGKLLFHERLDLLRVTGMALIVIGVALAGGFL